MRLSAVTAAVLCAILSSGVGYAASVDEKSIDAGRGNLKLTVPDDYDKSKPAPLIMLIHGYTGSGAGQDSYLKISALADEFGFLFVAPDGTIEDSEDKNRFWNATEACCDFHGSKVDDSGYLRRVIAMIKEKYAVAEDRVYLIGHSNGGFMSHRMAMDHPDIIAAVACLNGAAPGELDGPRAERPVNVLQIHGTVDRLNDYEGGDINGVPYSGAVGTVEKWAAYNGLSTEPKKLETTLDLDRVREGSETTITQYGDGDVELWTMNAVGHIPAITDSFSRNIVKWLMAHPKTDG